MPVELGTEVRVGDPLVRIEPRELTLALERAESALRQVEEHALQGHEHASRILSEQLVVQAPQNLLGLVSLSRQRSQQRHRDRHEERRGNAFARDVAERDQHPVGGQSQDLVEVAADLLRRLQYGMHVQARAVDVSLDACRQQAHLDLA